MVEKTVSDPQRPPGLSDAAHRGAPQAESASSDPTVHRGCLKQPPYFSTGDSSRISFWFMSVSLDS